MNHQSILAVSATLLASASINAQAQAWETYPQGAFSPWVLAVHPAGTTAYAVNDVLIRRGDAGGTSWSNGSLPAVPEGYELFGGNPKLAVGPSGMVYLAGGIRKLSDGSRTFNLWQSADGATTWQSVYSAAYTPPVSELAIGGVATDASGNIYLASDYRPGTPGSWASTLFHYRIRKGVMDPQTGAVAWTVVDDYPGSGQFSHNAHSITIRPASNSSLPAEIWVAGTGIDAKTFKNSFPFVRRSLDGGATWTTETTWMVPSGYSFSGGGSVVAGADVDGVAYVSASYGKKVGKNTQQYWLTYRSQNHGATWTPVDTFLAGTNFGPSDFAADSLGGVFISGDGFVRASVDGGINWASPNLSGAISVAADLVGDVFIGASVVSGNTIDGHIYKLPAPAP